MWETKIVTVAENNYDTCRWGSDLGLCRKESTVWNNPESSQRHEIVYQTWVIFTWKEYGFKLIWVKMKG